MIGTPVIGSHLGGIPELIIESDTGFTFDPKSVDQLCATIQKAFTISETDYLRMSENARQFAKDNFSEESHFQKLIKNYQYIINHNPA